VSAGRATAVIRTSALIALGAFVVHQARYVGHDDGGVHGYLGTVLPVLVVLGASGIAGTLASTVRRGRAARRGPAGWLFCSAVLLAVFSLQETAEGMLSATQPAGIAGLFGRGGWVAVPLAIVVGRIVSLLLAGLASVERKLAGTRTRTARRAPARLGRPRSRQARALTSRPLAFGLARRPPPHPIG
jgi:hypothetical protein